jgi:Protein of unknown function (DUF3443)
MSPAHRLIALLGLTLLGACGGGGGTTSTSGSSSTSGAHNFSGGGSNVVMLTVGDGPSGVQSTFNIPYASVTICDPTSNKCASINNVLVDTGSTGMRIIKSALDTAGVSLQPLTDPNTAANTIAECLPFADGYAWGSVAMATVRVGGEIASSIPIQVIDDGQAPSPAVPGSCSSNGSSLNSIDAFDANGVLGVGLFIQDCGSACVGTAANGVYYSCNPAGNCASSMLALADQVSNPVSSFATDNNGVILQLPAIDPTGAVSATGYLVFGIATQNNNALNGAGIYSVDGSGNFNTTFGSSVLSGFIDSGSNALFFPDNSIPLCGATGTGGASFYCPNSTMSLTAINAGGNGTTHSESFQIANLNNINNNDFAISDAGGPATAITGVGASYFDWGLPFFFGNTVFIAIEGTMAAGASGPYFAY